MSDKLGDRMKEYEKCYDIKLPKKHQVIIRIDGKAFHTFTRGMKKPFDNILIRTMQETAGRLFTEVQNCKAVYTQSDEISLLLDDTTTNETDAWFDNKLQKIVSISSSIATVIFNRSLKSFIGLLENEEDKKLYTKFLNRNAIFDARAFILPKDDVANYFVWRQRDWNRNSIQMLCRSVYSAKQMHGMKTPKMHDMLHDKGMNWAKLDGHLKNGTLYTDHDMIVDKFTYEDFNMLVYNEESKVKQ